MHLQDLTDDGGLLTSAGEFPLETTIKKRKTRCGQRKKRAVKSGKSECVTKQKSSCVSNE